MYFFKKTAGFGATFFVAIINFILMKLLYNHVTDMNKLIEGVILVAPFIAFFLLIAAMLTIPVDKLKLKNKIHYSFGYIFIGVVVSILAISGLYNMIDISFYVFVTCLIGSIIFYLVGLINSQAWLWIFTCIPVIFLLATFLY